MTPLFENSQQDMAEIVYTQKEKPKLHYNGFCYNFHYLTEIVNKDTEVVKKGESSMSHVLLVRIWITLQSFKMRQENITITLMLKGSKEHPEKIKTTHRRRTECNTITGTMKTYP